MTKSENRGSETFCGPPPPQDRVKVFALTLLKGGSFLRPHFNMAKTSSFHRKTTPTFSAPPPPSAAWFKLFPPPSFHRGKTSLDPPPLHFVAPSLLVINDQSLSLNAPPFFIIPSPMQMVTPQFSPVLTPLAVT